MYRIGVMVWPYAAAPIRVDSLGEDVVDHLAHVTVERHRGILGGTCSGEHIVPF